MHDRGFRVKLVTHLIKVGDLQLGTTLDLALIRFQFTEDQLQQGRFAGAVDADDANAVATHDRQIQRRNDCPAIKGLAYLSQLCHQLARAIASVER